MTWAIPAIYSVRVVTLTVNEFLEGNLESSKQRQVMKRVTPGEPVYLGWELVPLRLTRSLLSVESGDFVYVQESKGFVGVVSENSNDLLHNCLQAL